MPEANIRCSRCGVWQPPTAFAIHRLRGTQHWCRKCYNAYYREKRSNPKAVEATRERGRRTAAKRRKTQPIAVARYKRANKYGLTVVELEAMIERQGGQCAICHVVLTEIGPLCSTTMCVDHNESTGAVRGLLCLNCNVGIGHLRHDRQLIRAAGEYLRRTEKPSIKISVIN